MIDVEEHYYLVGDGPLAEAYYSAVRNGGHPRDALGSIRPGFKDRACVEGFGRIYKPNIVEIRGHLILSVPEYRETTNPFTPTPDMTEIKKWQVYRLRDEGVLDVEEAAA